MRVSSRILGVVGLTAWLVGLGLNQPEPARASTSYSETWQAASYREMSFYDRSNANTKSSWVCLGPASWTVTLYVGGTQAGQETWQVMNWMNTTQPAYAAELPIGDMRFDYRNNLTCTNPNGAVTNGFVIGGLTRSWIVSPAGLYGAMVYFKDSSDSYRGNLLTTAKSWPSVWYIQGTLD